MNTALACQTALFRDTDTNVDTDVGTDTPDHNHSTVLLCKHPACRLMIEPASNTSKLECIIFLAAENFLIFQQTQL